MRTMETNDKFKLSGLARRLVNAKLLAEDVAVDISIKSTEGKKSLVAYIIENKLVNPSNLATQTSIEFGIPFFDLYSLDLDYLPKTIINPKVIERGSALPIYKHGDKLFVAISDPTNVQALDELKFHTSFNIETILVEYDKLPIVTTRVMSMLEVEALNEEDESLDNIEIGSESDNDNEDVGDTPIVRFVNKILIEAINDGASDVHFEPYEKSYRVRLRKDGILYETSKPPKNISGRLATRLKVMANLDISERRVPQDGRCQMRLSKSRAIDFRVSSCPTQYGEKIVLRILDSANTQMGIESLGYEDFQIDLFMKAIHQPQGMILVTGPTGSGKTVSLYSAIDILNTVERNISTCEDPVEINLPGINQVSVNLKAGLGFAEALRSFLRQDPDVVMVGEIRDLETAEISVKAAQTGHLVLSTLHTNSAAETIVRLLNIGIPTYNLATAVTLVIAQRLTRKLCDHCKRKTAVPRNVLEEMGFDDKEISNLTVYEPVGCNRCNNGFKGRVGIYEVMPITPDIAQIIMEGADAIKISQAARANGVWNLRQAGMSKVKQGLTTIDEVYRVTKEG